jgi:cytochrome c oxidase cbb3-type subunit I
MQPVVNWWYSANLNLVWLGLVGLATVFHFVERLTGRALHSPYLAFFTFWTLILFASWTGIPNSAPVPAWMPALSTVATVLTVITVLSVMLNVYQTVGRGCSQSENPPPGKFIAFGTTAFVVAWLMNVAGALPGVREVTHFTWFTVAQEQLNLYGFFAMTMFGAIYHIVPQVAGLDWPSAKSVRAHFWLAAAGMVLSAAPLAIGGVLQGIRLNHAEVEFMDLTRGTLPFLRVSTLGELLILSGHLLFLANLLRLWVRYCRIRLAPVCAAATVELTAAEVKS